MLALVGHHKLVLDWVNNPLVELAVNLQVQLPNHLMLGPRVAVRKLLKQSAKLLGAVGEV